MSDLKELTGIIEQAKADRSAQITITGDSLLDLLDLARVLADMPATIIEPEVDVSFPPAIEEAFISIGEVCGELGISDNTLLKMRNAGKFIPEKTLGGKKVRFLRSDFEHWKRTSMDYVPHGFQAASR